LNKCCALAKHWHTLRHYNNTNTNKLTSTTTTAKSTADTTANANVTAVGGSSNTSYETRGAVCDDDITCVLQILSSQGVFGSYGIAIGTEQQQQQGAASLTFDSLAAAAAAMDNEQQVIFVHYKKL
jgi:hypothetical protein